MHELSLVRNIFASLEDSLTLEEIARLEQVDMQIGLLANVEPVLLQNAFKAFLMSNPQYEQSRLNIDLIRIRIHCNACGTETQVENYSFKCDACGMPSRDIRSGEELLVHKIHLKAVAS
jgi:hydrogenase nickel incorporation protein HypA/HybF